MAYCEHDLDESVYISNSTVFRLTHQGLKEYAKVVLFKLIERKSIEAYFLTAEY